MPRVRTECARTVNELNHLILFLSPQTTVSRHRVQ